jgi:hypothetical protein
VRRKGRVSSYISEGVICWVDKVFEVVFDELQVVDVLLGIFVKDVTYLCHNFCEEVHPDLQINMPLADLWTRKVVHARSERGSSLVETVVPAKYQSGAFGLGSHEPFVPLCQFLEVLRRKGLLCEELLLVEIRKSQDEGWWIAILNVLGHKSRTVAKLLSLLASILLARDPATIEHSVQPALNDPQNQVRLLPYSHLAVKAIVPQKAPGKPLP